VPLLISPEPEQEGKKLQRQKIFMFIYHIYYHSTRNISTIYIYIYNKTGIKRNILTIKQNASGSKSGQGLISTSVLYRNPEMSLLVGGRIQQPCVWQENTLLVKGWIKLHIVAPTYLLLQITPSRLVSLEPCRRVFGRWQIRIPDRTPAILNDIFCDVFFYFRQIPGQCID